MRAPNVFTISPALPFLDTFVSAFLAGAIVPGFTATDDPLALAHATIYVPTRRAARALAETFARQANGGSLVLPHILPLGALDATETPLIFAEPDPEGSGLPLPPAASPIWRRMRLATMIQTWANAIKGALRTVDAAGAMSVDESEAFRVATSTVDAFALAGDLAALIDELLIEDVAWRELDDLRMADFDDYWRITTTFLSIAIDRWPKILKDKGLVDPAARQIALVAAQAASFTDGRTLGPVVAIGSTGTNKATARLLAAIAHAAEGAVVLPGLDRDLDEPAWTIVSGTLAAGQEPSFGHPQAAMARLLPILGISRADVRSVGKPDGTMADRARFVAEALRPADSTDLWRAYRKSLAPGALQAALAGLALIEAADEREEALCLAVALREVLETPGRTAALITPDRELARRVRGELLRWDVEVLDTGGEPLSGRPLGVLARLAVAAAGSGLGAREATALLAHALATFGRPRDEVARLAVALEIGVLRVVSPFGKSAEDLFVEARGVAGDRHAHRLQKAITFDEWTDMIALWRDLETALSPLRSLVGEQPLHLWVEAHRHVVQAVAGTASSDETEALDTLFDALGDDDMALAFDIETYGIFFGRLAGDVAMRNTDEPHPRLQIYGLLEARLMRADVMLLGGLDETIWPPQAKSDAFLNRPMRHDLGLSPPERRIGQTAHDFEQALGASTVIMSRARKRGGAPSVASRFLLRLEALGGDEWTACAARGKRFVELARVLDRSPKDPVAIRRPHPRPPIDLRPKRLSVTAIETLRRDPYSIYADKILKLAPLPHLGADIEPSEIGNLVHNVLHMFVAGQTASGSPAVRRATLRDLAANAFAKALQDPLFKAFRWPNILKMIDVFLSFDAKQRERGGTIEVETDGKLVLALADETTFTLTARADRIDWHADGSASLIDYKTGMPPGNKEVEVGFAPQLTLEAAMLRGGGFGAPHAGPIAATYLKLGGKDGGFERAVEFKTEAFDAVVDRHFEGLHRLLSSFLHIETGYPSRPFPKYARDHGDYDHLARVREWSLASDEEVAP